MNLAPHFFCSFTYGKTEAGNLEVKAALLTQPFYPQNFIQNSATKTHQALIS